MAPGSVMSQSPRCAHGEGPIGNEGRSGAGCRDEPVPAVRQWRRGGRVPGRMPCAPTTIGAAAAAVSYAARSGAAASRPGPGRQPRRDGSGAPGSLMDAACAIPARRCADDHRSGACGGHGARVAPGGVVSRHSGGRTTARVGEHGMRPVTPPPGRGGPPICPDASTARQWGSRSGGRLLV